MTAIEELKAATETVYQKADAFYGRSFARPMISLRLRGVTAGTASWNKRLIRYNHALYMENKEDFVARTVPHEVAHMIVAELAYRGGFFRRPKPHGQEWKNVCRNIGMKDITRCHKYDVTNTARRRARPFTYRCGCQEFNLTMTLHRRILMGQRRWCKKCKVTLQYIGEKT